MSRKSSALWSWIRYPAVSLREGYFDRPVQARSPAEDAVGGAADESLAWPDGTGPRGRRGKESLVGER